MDNSLELRFGQHLAQLELHHAVANGVLVAWSGGLDSTVLVHLLHSMGAKVCAAHCNFQLRGPESEGDEAFVQAQAAAWGITCWTQKMDTKAHAEVRRVSIQMAARQLRYEWFAKIMEQHTLECLFTAHHANDNAETLLLNQLRGTGLRGMGGIPPFANFSDKYSIARPLLPFSRAELEAYAHHHRLQWREDSSNAHDDYLRNYLRHHVMPALAEAKPQYLDVFHRNAEYARASYRNYTALLRQHLRWQQKNPNTYTFDLVQLRSTADVASSIWEILSPFGFNSDQARQIAQNLDKARLVIDRKLAILSLASDDAIEERAIAENDLMVKIPRLGTLFFMGMDAVHEYPDGKTAIVVPKAALRFPLRLRPWKAGDAFQPMGMGGKHQKLQDFLTNLKISRLDKERINVLLNGDGAVIWVVGLRPDERFRVQDAENSVVKITLIT
jgi:tRNA(Ile)-lysidine synthase